MESIAHDASIEASRSAEFGHLLEQVTVGCEEERKPWSKGIDGQPRIDGSSYVLDGIRQGECQFLDRGGAGFANMVSGDRDRIPAGKLVGAEAKHFRDQRHAGPCRVNVRAAGDVLLQNV